jgi:outer membrane protein TolC
MTRYATLVCLMLCAPTLFADVTNFALTLSDAETEALNSSWRLKSAHADVTTSQMAANAGFASLFPRITLQGSYTYLSTLPELSFSPQQPKVTFGDHNNYNFGPTLSYTLWDTFSARKNYQSLEKIREAREQDRMNAEVQLLFNVRASYVRLQLALEELRLVSNSVELAKAQSDDIKKRFDAGSATKLDTIVSRRHIFAFQIQFEQKQAEVATALRDLLAVIGNTTLTDISRPGPKGIQNVKLTLSLDPLSSTLGALSHRAVAAPGEDQPQIRSLELLKESSEISAESLRSKLFPALQINLSTALVYPNGPQLVPISQSTIGLVFSVPLYLGDPTWRQIDQKRSEARAAHFRARQLKLDVNRDYQKATQLLDSLKAQRKLAEQDVADSSEVARLYYSSYKDGKGNLIDVQAANNDAFQAKINLARIDSQMISQYISLFALAGKDATHD